MEIPTVKAASRKSAGSRAAARLRRSGKLPAIVYGHKENPVSVSLERHDVEQHLSRGAHLVNLEMEGKTQPCLIKDAQYDYLGAALVHLDLARVSLTESVRVKVPLELRGTPKGIAEGGVLRQELMELEVECTVTSIPERVRVNVADMTLNQVLHVKELTLDAGLKAMTDPDSVVATCRVPLVKVEVVEPGAVAAPTAAEPEVIAKGKIEEEGAEPAEKDKKPEKEKKPEKDKK
jgi:large subunit ribosomal protein L25